MAVPIIARAQSWIVALGIGVLGAGTFIVVVASEKEKIALGLIGALLCALTAMVSGNPRLFCLWGLMLVMPFNVSKLLGPILNKGGGEYAFRIEAADPFIIALLGFIVRDLVTERRAGLRIPKIAWLWVLIMLMSVITIAVGPLRTTAAHELFRQAKMLVLFIVLVHELERTKRFMQCVAAIALSVAIQGATGVVQRVLGRALGLEFLGEISSETSQVLSTNSVVDKTVFRVSGFLIHPNLFGVFLATLLPLLIAAFLHHRVHKGFKALLLLAIPLGMASLLATLSRSGWASFSAAFAVLMLLLGLHPVLRKRSLFAAAVTVVAIAVIVVAFREPIMARLFNSRADAMLGRAEYNASARKMIAEKFWTGWGVNSYVYAVPPFTPPGARGAKEYYNGWIAPVHNIYYLWWAETGLIGLLIHLWLIAAVIWTAIQNLRVRDDMLYAFNVGCLAAMPAFIVDGFFSFSLRLNSILRVFWIIAAMVVAIRYRRLHTALGDGSTEEQADPTEDKKPRLDTLGDALPVAVRA